MLLEPTDRTHRGTVLGKIVCVVSGGSRDGSEGLCVKTIALS